MLMQILTHTPTWVVALLLGLLCLGVMQSRPRRVPGLRLLILPVAMLGLSLSGVWTSFAAAPLAWLGWFAGALLAVSPNLAKVLRHGLTTGWSTRRFDVAGSWVPMLLMLGIFFSKYLIAVLFGMGKALPNGAVAVVCTLLGMCSGVLLARALRVLTGAAVAPAAV